MSIFLIKSLLSIPLVLLTFLGMFTMLEIFGRSDRKYSVEKLKRVHSICGIIYISFFVLISYLCITYIARTQVELSPRGTIHALLALAITLLLFIKITIVNAYRQWYGQTKILGMIIAVLSFLMAGSSAGYYLLAYGAIENNIVFRQHDGAPEHNWTIPTDTDRIKSGKALFASKCIPCHDPQSTRTIVGPGLKCVMRKAFLPVSKKPTTPANLANQLRNPLDKMPSFAYLSDGEILDILAYMNTL